MPMDLLYLGWVLVVGVLLWRWKYYRAWRTILPWIAAQVVLITVDTFVPNSSRVLNERYWLPAFLLQLTGWSAVVGEVLWRSMAGMPRRHKWGVSLSLLWGVAVFSHGARYFIGVREYGDWYDQLIHSDIRILQLGIACVSVVSFGLFATLTGRLRRSDAPRYGKLHSGVVAVLSCATVWFADFSRWQWSTQMIRAVEVSALVAFLVNGDLLRREALGAGIRSWQDAFRSPHPPATSRGASLLSIAPHAPIPQSSPARRHPVAS